MQGGRTLNPKEKKMKETVNVNIGSQAFTLDRDASDALRSYLEAIRSRLPEEDTETLGDIEARMAELFREKVPSPMLVVSLATVREVMARMGTPEDFGASAASDGPRPDTEGCATGSLRELGKLRRSRENRSIAGVCGGIAEFFGTDPTLVRLMALLLVIVGGFSAWIYLILWLIIPDAPLKRNF